MKKKYIKAIEIKMRYEFIMCTNLEIHNFLVCVDTQFKKKNDRKENKNLQRTHINLNQ